MNGSYNLPQQDHDHGHLNGTEALKEILSIQSSKTTDNNENERQRPGTRPLPAQRCEMNGDNTNNNAGHQDHHGQLNEAKD